MRQSELKYFYSLGSYVREEPNWGKFILGEEKLSILAESTESLVCFEKIL